MSGRVISFCLLFLLLFFQPGIVLAQPDVDEEELSPRQRVAARRAEMEAEELAAQQAEVDRVQQHWLSRLEARGVSAWGEDTAAKSAAALAKSRAMVTEAIRLVPDTELYETEYFLFASNIPARQVRPYVRSLDHMYEWMCELYGIPLEQPVWLGGKAPIFAFLTEEQFHLFERTFFQIESQGIYGLCHQSDEGQVFIVCFRGDDPDDFGQMLVHETSHGFIHRYKTNARLPSWVNEGMADLIGAEMVPRSRSVGKKEQVALMQLKQRRTLDNFFSADPIVNWQYGIASSMNRFLLNTDQEAYVQFIELLKEGMPWDEALQTAYGGTPRELVSQYGLWIGVPDLMAE